MGVLGDLVHTHYPDFVCSRNVTRFHETRRRIPLEEKSVSGCSCKCVIEHTVETLHCKIINSSVCIHIYQSYIVQDGFPPKGSRLANFVPVRIFYTVYMRMLCVCEQLDKLLFYTQTHFSFRVCSEEIEKHLTFRHVCLFSNTS